MLDDAGTIFRALFVGAAFAAGSLDLHAQETIVVGALATLEGPFMVLGQDGMRGVELALKERNYMAGGRKIELVKGSSNGSPESAVAAARKLVEQDRAQILIGPLSGSEGIAIKDYAKTQPQVTFLNGSSGAQETTLLSPAPNFFRFSTDGAQWSAGLGLRAIAKGYRKVVVVAEDYAFPYSQVAGFMMEYCKAGGRVLDKYWVPIGTKDYSSVITRLPPDLDAVYVALGGSDAVNFLAQYERNGGNKPLIGGTIMVDQTVLAYRGKRRDALAGTLSSGPIADSNYTAPWLDFVAAYRKAFKDAFPSPSLFAHGYYVNTKAALDALDAVKGDLAKDHQALRKTLSTMTLKTPTGDVKLDTNRNAIANIYVTEVVRLGDGSLINKVVQVMPAVSQTLGLSKADFDRIGVGSRTNPECR